jgi:hypothetical protein
MPRPLAGQKTAPQAGGVRGVGAGAVPVQANSASALRIFFMAATSIWRTRSALTP